MFVLKLAYLFRIWKNWIDCTATAATTTTIMATATTTAAAATATWCPNEATRIPLQILMASP